jgi:hydroxypyruvate reductase
MAQVVEAHYPVPCSGLVVTRYGHALPTKRIEVIEAGHPLPDENGLRAARRILDEAQRLGMDDLMLALFSGGGSSLLTLPLPGITLEDMRAVTHALLLCGARIEEINIVRKHLSAIQGGRLAAATRAEVCALIISDVTGDDPTDIASGPCAPDPSTFGDALAVLGRYRISAPPRVIETLRRGARGEIDETPKPGAPCFAHVRNLVVASASQMLAAAAEFFRARDVAPVSLGDTVTGEARLVAREQAAQIRELRARGRTPCVLLSGGETTVTVKGPGRGGRNAEFLLALAIELRGMADVTAIACGSDGIDGTEDNAGAIIQPDTLERAATLGMDAQAYLANNDSYGFFAALGDLVVTGPTHTNVNDYRAILLT